MFLGWYYDSALTRAAGTNDTVNGNTTLYAKLGEVMAVNANEAETPNYVTVTVPAANVSGYTFGISGYTAGCIDSFINVTANNETVSCNVSNGVVSFAPQQGQTYRVELTADSDARFVVDGAEPGAERARAEHRHGEGRGGQSHALRRREVHSQEGRDGDVHEP